MATLGLRLLFSLLLMLGGAGLAQAEQAPQGDAAEAPAPTLVLGAPFTDGAVLQRQMDVPAWGLGDAGRSGHRRLRRPAPGPPPPTRTAPGVVLDPMDADRLTSVNEAAGGREMRVREAHPGGSSEVVVRDVLIGEVWL